MKHTNISKEQLIEKLRESKIPMTTTRFVILDFISKNSGHFSTEDVYNLIKKDFPSISLGTIYNNLSIFAKIGILKELRIEKERVVYDTNVYPHSHFLCMQCGKIYDVPSLDFKTPKEIDGHSVEYADIYYFGICRECREKGQ